MITRVRKKKKWKCHTCEMPGHLKKGVRKNKKTICYHYEETGHLIRIIQTGKGKGKDKVQDLRKSRLCSRGQYIGKRLEVLISFS